ncbi:hypothetical protein BCR44DRAFT_1006900 [Catenaria anguillulae PL171]|uniref:Uncharacterized protein n=1 Tax=Catenaria anguillulae PL171 TaxID=765915 RepID=A0A1Y2I3L5_9FUNG|nr:hypothetical protein BCR44DRAFT_1006900 [Catenaria anguillulae PL171]
MGIAVAIDLSTVVTSLMLWNKTGRSFYYLWLTAIALAHTADLLLGNLATANTLTSQVGADGQFVSKNISMSTLLANIFSLVFAWIGGVGFIALNMSRFYAIGASRLPAATKGLVVLTAVSILICTGNNIMYIASYIGKYRDGANSEAGDMVKTLDFMFSVWSIYDALANTFISVAFITLLKQISIGSGTQLRKGFAEMLTRVTWILGFECSLIIAANLFVLAAPLLDPGWISIYISESIRLRMFCLFLLTLSRMLKKKVAPSSAQAPTAIGSAIRGPAFPMTALNAKQGQLGQGQSSNGTGQHSSSHEYVSPL